MMDSINSQWLSDYIEDEQWEKTSQILEEDVELKEWKFINFEEYEIKGKIAFLDGVIKLDDDIFDTKTKTRIKIFSLASAVCEIGIGLYNTFDAFKSLKTKRVAIPDKDMDKNYIRLKDKTYGIMPKGYDHISVLKALEQESLTDYIKNANTNIIIWDGSLPITFKDSADKKVFGFIKTHKKYFMSEEHLPMLFEITSYQRTPIIYYTPEGKTYYYTWYSTLNENVSGLVRLETLANEDVKYVSDMANYTSYMLRMFASSPIFEKRAPQNLSPISALESFLKAYLGYHFVDIPVFS